LIGSIQRAVDEHHLADESWLWIYESANQSDHFTSQNPSLFLPGASKIGKPLSSLCELVLPCSHATYSQIRAGGLLHLNKKARDINSRAFMFLNRIFYV
jgi:hypothetical protein